MNYRQPSNWDVFTKLCAILGGQNKAALMETVSQRQLPLLLAMAQEQDLLHALACRCNEQLIDRQALDEPTWGRLQQALLANTQRNMQIVAQAVKLARKLNKSNITPLFLKGTSQLLTTKSNQLGFRKQVDIDLLVEPQQLGAASDILLEEGYYYYPIPSHRRLYDTRSAVEASSGHHHLPPLAKEGYTATVELHRHFLPRRFQHNNPIRPMFNEAVAQRSHDASFLVPSPDYQVIHQILGSFVHDGHFSRRTLPLREACDYIDLTRSSGGKINKELVEQHCGKYFGIFSSLVMELMDDSPATAGPIKNVEAKRLRLMKKRYNSKTIANILDARARALHLGSSLLHSPGKLLGYLSRLR